MAVGFVESTEWCDQKSLISKSSFGWALEVVDGFQCFCKRHLASGYWQAEVSPEPCEETGAAIPKGFNKFLMITFRLSLALVTF